MEISESHMALLGLATFYFLPGNVLYCGPYYIESNEPWVAVDVNLYKSGAIKCGDIVDVVTPSGSLRAKAMDAGYLDKYGFIVDIPKHLSPFNSLSSKATMSFVERRLRLREH